MALIYLRRKTKGVTKCIITKFIATYEPDEVKITLKKEINNVS